MSYRQVLVCCFWLTLMPCVRAQRQAATVSAQDTSAILRVIYSYSYAFDQRDIEGLISLFSEDAVWEAYTTGATAPFISLSGKAHIRAGFLEQMNNQIAQGIQSRHYQTNTVLSALSSDRVEGITMIMVTWRVTSPEPAMMIHATGYYVDEFVRAGNHWHFVKRRSYVDAQ